jgi:hypothetical protein
MTTLAYRDGVLAADSRGIRERAIVAGNLTKVWKLDDGRLVGYVGDVATASKFVRALRDQAELPQLVDTIVVVIGDKITVYQDDSHYDDDCEFSAWGTGAQAALAAFYMDATAEKAVEVATRIDANSGGPVQTVKRPSTKTQEQLDAEAHAELTVSPGACPVCDRAPLSCPSCRGF